MAVGSWLAACLDDGFSMGKEGKEKVGSLARAPSLLPVYYTTKDERDRKTRKKDIFLRISIVRSQVTLTPNAFTDRVCTQTGLGRIENQI